MSLHYKQTGFSDDITPWKEEAVYEHDPETLLSPLDPLEDKIL